MVWSPTGRVGDFNTFNYMETRSLKRVPRHPFKTFNPEAARDGPEGTTFKARVPHGVAASTRRGGEDPRCGSSKDRQCMRGGLEDRNGG